MLEPFKLKQSSSEIQTSLDATKNIDTIVSNIQTFKNDFYGDETQVDKFIPVWSPVDLNEVITNPLNKFKPLQSKEWGVVSFKWYSTSTFCGYGSYVGPVKNFNIVRVPCGKREDDISPTKCCITVLEIPEDLAQSTEDPMEFNKNIITWNKLHQEVFDLKKPLTTTPEILEFRLSKMIENNENKKLMMSIVFERICLLPNYIDMSSHKPWKPSDNGLKVNTFSASMTVPSIGKTTPLPSVIRNVGNAVPSLNESTFRIFIGELGRYEPATEIGDLDTSKNGKFYNLVKETINNGVIDDSEPIPQQEKYNYAEIVIAKKYDLVVGDTFQLFYKSIIKTQNINNYMVVVYGDPQKSKVATARNWLRYWEYTPSDLHVGENTIHIELRDMDGKIIDSKTTILVVHKKPVISSPKTINCLFFGASLMSDGVICGEALRRINGNTSSGKPDPLNIANLTLKSFGHNANYVNNYKVNHEAYGGWTWKNFLTNNNVSRVNGIIVTLSSPHGYEINTVQKSIWTDNNGLKWELEELPSSTTIKFNRHENTKPQNEITLPTSMTSESLSLSITISKSEWEPGNPFWNPDTNEVDFNYHANKYGAEGGYQIAYCITTYNQAGVPFPGTEDWNKDISDYAKRNIEENIKPLLRILHKQMPNCKMIIPSIALPSDMGGIATSYTTNTFYGCSLKMKAYAFEYSRCLEELCLEDEFKDWVIFNDDKAQFDVDYSYPTGTRKANARATTEEDIQTNAIHPTKEGKELIADSLFRGIIKILNSDI